MDQATLTLLSLPPEVRTVIYTYALTLPQPIHLRSPSHRRLRPSRISKDDPTSLLSVSRLVRTECLPLYHRLNPLIFRTCRDVIEYISDTTLHPATKSWAEHIAIDEGEGEGLGPSDDSSNASFAWYTGTNYGAHPKVSTLRQFEAIVGCLWAFPRLRVVELRFYVLMDNLARMLRFQALKHFWEEIASLEEKLVTNGKANVGEQSNMSINNTTMIPIMTGGAASSATGLAADITSIVTASLAQQNPHLNADVIGTGNHSNHHPVSSWFDSFNAQMRPVFEEDVDSELQKAKFRTRPKLIESGAMYGAENPLAGTSNDSVVEVDSMPLGNANINTNGIESTNSNGNGATPADTNNTSARRRLTKLRCCNVIFYRPVAQSKYEQVDAMDANQGSTETITNESKISQAYPSSILGSAHQAVKDRMAKVGSRPEKLRLMYDTHRYET